MKSLFLLLVVATPLIYGQQSSFFRSQGNSNRRILQGGGNQDTKLGLLGPQIGVAPVPGGNFNQFGSNVNQFGERPGQFGGGGRPGQFGGGGNNFNANQFGRPATSPFVDGNSGNVPHTEGPRGCFCLPKNQVCSPSDPIPRGATRIKKVDTRIINLNPRSVCPEEEKVCCFEGTGNPSGPIIGNPSGPIIIPEVPIGNRGCGFNKRLSIGHPTADQAEFGEYPWMAVITQGSRSNFIAGGAIVSPTTILTAAHKITGPAQQLKVRVGDYNLNVPNEVPQFPHQEIAVSRVIYHPQYNPRSESLKNDVAILKLSHPIRYGAHINAVCLPEQGQTFTGSRCWLSGWGKNAHGNNQPILREVDLPAVDEFECQEKLKTKLGQRFKLDSTSFMCAGGEFGKDACTGDGGSPLVCQEHNGAWTVVGLVAWGVGCGELEIPGVYVNIPAYANFINQYL